MPLAVETLGFDACIDRRHKNFAEQLAGACPDGVDIYFENVGGYVFEAAWNLLDVGARVPVCGLISQYDGCSTPPSLDRLPGMMMNILMRRIKVEGFIIIDHYGPLFEVFSERSATGSLTEPSSFRNTLSRGWKMRQLLSST